MRIIIVGAGRTGSAVIDLATVDGHDVVVIDDDPDVIEAVRKKFDCDVLNADATSFDVLENAGASNADAAIATTSDDSTNLMVTMLADKLGVESLVCSVNDPDNIDVFRELGVNIVESPHELNGRYLYRAVQRPAIKDFMEVGGGAEVFEITVSKDAPITGRTLIEADSEGLLPEDTILVAIQRDDGLHIPRGQTKVLEGDLLTVFSSDGATAEIVSPFTDARPEP
ncbi:potassium channel family protein [Natrinema pallidum]|uniref:TrkA-N domain protein n=1 Tax=Natrinema pallidum DSM 3751 TaxID=1227495 RepID=L9YEF4_9EURY|nr:TrkA family potassium uptake protein [Natrinema pallidum]ELY72031.1 TrkA-N domain protein [Natrinema pallidum DSM 3751]